MHTAYLPTLHASPPDVSTDGGPQVWTSLKQVSSDGHQMSLAGGQGQSCGSYIWCPGRGFHVWCPGEVWGWGSHVWCRGGAGLEPGLVGDPHVTITHEAFHLAVQAPCEQTDWQADRHVWKHYLPASPLAGGKL